MTVIRAAIGELVGMFIDDGALALAAAILIGLVAVGVKSAGLPPLAGALVLLAGCLLILIESAHRAARKRRG